MSNFQSLGLSAQRLEVLQSIGFEKPTPIQELAIPQLLENDPTDFIGLAQTGTGKTAAFGLPLLDLIQTDVKATQALILAPTRELAQQTAKQLEDFSANSGLRVVVVYGGANIVGQMKELKRPTHVIVATPGRLMDLMNRKSVDLSMVQYLVLDEADEMLNMGFKEDIDHILSHTPEGRTTWLFSATMPKEIRRIVKTYMADPIEVAVNTEQRSNEDITHQFIISKQGDKLEVTKRFLEMTPNMRGIMFCRTKRETQEIAEQLIKENYSVEALHGDLSQAQRDKVMGRFKQSKMQLLIATDVAARGIDVNDLSHVLHHTLPDQLESYTHRSGRTGRAGKKGLSIAFINTREGRKISELERKLGVTFEKIAVPSAQEVQENRLINWADELLGMQVSEEAENYWSVLQDKFDELTKEDVLKKLISKQFEELNLGSGRDLNTTRKQEKEDRRGGKSERGEGRYTDGVRYFINVGRFDGINKKDLVDFISEITSIPGNAVNDVALQEKHSYFSIPQGQDQGVKEAFQGIELEGRELRVNRDDGNSGSGKRKPKGRKNFDRSGGGRRNQRRRR